MATLPAENAFVGMYGCGRIAGAADARRRPLNVQDLCASDLRTLSPDGTTWDFRKRSHRDEAEAYTDEHKPMLVIGSPPCTGWCLMNWNLKFKKLTPTRVKEIVGDARAYQH